MAARSNHGIRMPLPGGPTLGGGHSKKEKDKKTVASRKDNFYAYYSTPEGKKKLNGKTVDEAYAAMRRNVVATGNRSGKLSSGDRGKNLNPVNAAVARRVERNRSTTEKDMKNLPGLRAKRLSTVEMMRSNFSTNGSRDSRKFNFAKENSNAGRQSGLSAAQKAALERRLKANKKNVSNDPSAAAAYRRIKYSQSRQA